MLILIQVPPSLTFVFCLVYGIEKSAHLFFVGVAVVVNGTNHTLDADLTQKFLRILLSVYYPFLWPL